MSHRLVSVGAGACWLRDSLSQARTPVSVLGGCRSTFRTGGSFGREDNDGDGSGSSGGSRTGRPGIGDRPTAGTTRSRVTKKRTPLFDDKGERIRGKASKEAAELALARERLTWEDDTVGAHGGSGEWLVARVCSEYIRYCESGLAGGTISKSHRDNTVAWLNDLSSVLREAFRRQA